MASETVLGAFWGAQSVRKTGPAWPQKPTSEPEFAFKGVGSRTRRAVPDDGFAAPIGARQPDRIHDATGPGLRSAMPSANAPVYWAYGLLTEATGGFSVFGEFSSRYNLASSPRSHRASPTLPAGTTGTVVWQDAEKPLSGGMVNVTATLPAPFPLF
jgi:hypothetical protein